MTSCKIAGLGSEATLQPLKMQRCVKERACRHTVCVCGLLLVEKSRSLLAERGGGGVSATCPVSPYPLNLRGDLSVLKSCVPKTLAFAFGLRLRSKTQCFKTRVLGRRLPNGKPQERLRFRALRSKTLAFKKRIAIIFLQFKNFPRGQGLRLGPLRSKNAAFCVCVLKPTKGVTFLRQGKRAQRLTFWVRRPPGGVGVFYVKGWWPKSSCPPLKVCLP